MTTLWKLVFITSILFLPMSGFAQETSLEDSLLAEIQQLPANIRRVEVLNELAWVKVNNNLAKALVYAQEAEKIALLINYKKGLATAYNRLGLVYQRQAKYETAIANYKKALRIEQAVNHAYGISRAKNQIGSVYMQQKKYLQAIIYFQESIQALAKVNLPLKIATKKINLGICYTKLGKFDKAIVYYLEAIATYEKSDKPRQVGKAYQGLGALYRQTGSFELARENLLKALSTFEKQEDQFSMATVYHELGFLDFIAKNYQAAETYYQRSLQIKKELGAKQNIQITYNGLGQVYLQQGKESEALELFRRSEEVATQRKDSLTLALVCNNIGWWHYLAGDYPKAINYFEKSLAFTNKLAHQDSKKSTFKNLSFAHDQLGNHKKAFEYFKQYNQIKTSLEDSFREAIQLKDSYEKERKVRQLAQKDNEIKKAKIAHEKEINVRKTLLIYFLIIGFALLLFMILAIIRDQRAQKEKRKKQHRIDQLMAEKEDIAINKMLEGEEKERTRIAQNLHDGVCGTLTAVKMKFEQLAKLPLERLEDTPQYLGFTQLLDETIEEVRDVSHQVSITGALKRLGLVAVVSDLLNDIEQTQAEMEVKLVTTALNTRQLPLSYETQVYRMVQQLVGNVLKHANAHQLVVQLYWKEQERLLHINVEDDGDGFDHGAALSKGGMGLQNIDQRVKNMGGTYSIDTAKGKGCSVLIDLPLHHLETLAD